MPKIFWLLLTTYVGLTYVEADSVVYSKPYEYIFVTTTKTWENAKADCETRKAVLVKIGSDAVTNIIRSNMPNEYMWMGASDTEAEGEWKWLDGTSAKKNGGAYNNWVDNQPDNWQNNEHCALVKRSDGQWVDVPCSSQYQYICQKHMIFVNPYPLLFSYDAKTWPQAKAECEKVGMHLLKIDSASLTTAITENSNENRWMGANDRDTADVWKWLDGTSAHDSRFYQNWGVGQPTQGNGEHCGLVELGQKWSDYPCNQQHKYICQKRVIYFTDQYQLYFSYNKKTWEQAKDECENNDSRLVKIDSQSLTDVITANSAEQRWIGASESASEGQWKWLDGTAIATGPGSTYQNWANGEPNNGGGNEDCGAVQGGGKWNDAACSMLRKFICQKRLQTSVLHNDHLIIFHRTEKVTWDAAKIACAAKGSRLVEIYNKATNDAIRQNIADFDEEFLCGGSENTGRVTWNSGRSASYTSGWASGEPNTNGQNKITLSVNGWKDVSSLTTHPYICEMKNLTTVTLSRGQITLDADVDETVTCSANGIPFSKVFWKFSSHEITTERSAIYQEKGNGTSILHVGTAWLMDEGNYICVAENNAGNFKKSLQKEFKLTVPSHPEVVIAETQECSTTITVRWKANSRASNVKHKIVVKSAENESEIYRFPDSGTTTPNMTFSFQARKWMMYNITVTPCPNDTCKDNYSGYNYTRRRTVGLPGKVENLKVQLSNKYNCTIEWNNPSEGPVEFISGYKVIVYGRLNYHPPESSDNANTNESIIDGNMTTHTIEGKPNFRYNVGIQTKTCVGFGDTEWKNASCITDSIAPEIVAKPQVSETVQTDGTMDVSIEIPSQENGQISCIFVIVSVQQPVSNDTEFDSATNYTRKRLDEATTSNEEYVALALDIGGKSGDKLAKTLGDGERTSCALLSKARRKRDVSENMIRGRNLRLDRYKNNSVFIVTSSPTRGGVLLKASEPVQVAAIPKSEVEPEVSNKVVTIGGAAGGAFVFLAILLVVIVIVLRGKKAKSERHIDPPVDSPYNNIDAGNVNETFAESQYVNVGEHPYEMSEDAIYENNGSSIRTKKRTKTDIPMNEFEKTYNDMHKEQGAPFTKQFEDLTNMAKSLPLSVEFASKPELKPKNRYKNILPYDNTRVPIQQSDDGYINACFIDGFEQKKKFIATQGPLAKTVNDFWLMVVEQRVTMIVMLAKCVEAGKKKCERYWPDIGGTSTFGSIAVSNVDEAGSCGFIRRTLKVKVNLEEEQEMTIFQYHFLTWPDHGFPVATSHILRMHKEVVETRRSHGSTSPIVVHCSAGAGRTGTFIGYDYILNESKSVGNADVFECVATMRRQRVQMVQNCDQYILVHKLLLETHIFGDTDISRQEVLQKFSDPIYKKKATTEEFANLSRVKPMDMTQKNSIRKICAYDRMRVKMYEDGSEIAKHLSASYIEAYDNSLKIIVARQPASAKTELFWKLFCNFNITAIVMITEDEHDSLPYWDHAPKDGEFTVEVDSEQITSNFTVRKLIIKATEMKSVTHLHLRLNSSQATRKTVSKINECVNRLQKELRELHGTALIHCKTGTGMSGVFCAMMNILERMAVEDRVDVFRAVKDLRDCKEGMIETQAQYAICYEGVLEYLRNFDTYSNFM